MKKNIIKLLLFLSIGQISHGMIHRVLPRIGTKSAIALQARLFSSTLVARESYNPYKILGITQAANSKDLKAAYYHLAKQYHPNVPGGTDEAFYDVYKAYEAVKNSIKDKNVFSRCNIAYTNSLVMGSRLDNYAELVSPSGISKKLLPAEMQKELRLKPAGYKEPVLEVFHIDDQVGFGVKTLEKISKNSLIKPYVGTVEVVHHSECDVRKYGLTVCGTHTQLMIDAEFAGNETRFCNHSYLPNAVIKPVLDEKTGFFQFWLVAHEDIQAGEEIVWNYGSAYWRSHNIVPVDKNIKHLYQDKQVTVFSYPKHGNAGIYINDAFVTTGDVLASNHITIGSKVFIIIVVKQGDMAMPVIYLKEDQLVKFVPDLSLFPQDVQAKLAECFHNAIKNLK